MRHAGLLLVLAAALLHAQGGQQAARPGWPCVPGRAVDPSYLEITEATGGQLYMLQKSDAAQGGAVMAAADRHKATILRAVGHLSGSKTFEFPVDSTVSSLLVVAFLQCRDAVALSRPSGAEITASSAAVDLSLQTGRVIRVEHPDAGPWRVRLAGTGLFLLSVLARSEIALTDVRFSTSPHSPTLGVAQTLDARVSGNAANLQLQLVDAGGDPLSILQPFEQAPEGAYRAGVTPPAERLRVLVIGTDAAAWPFQRMYPPLFHAAQPK